MATVTAVALPDGRRLSVECWPGDGAPLVLLHGLLDCAAGWKHLAAVMRRPCFAVDLPGFGGSDRPTRSRISAYAEDVQAALDKAVELGGKRLVGPIKIPAGTFAWFADPDGNTIGLLKPAQP